MKLEAMMKIRIAGATASERNASTSLALKRAPMTPCRRSKPSLTRLRKSRRSSRRKTTRFRLNRAKITMFEATGSSGANELRSKADRPPTSTRKPRMTRRLRLRRFCSERSGIAYCILWMVRYSDWRSVCSAVPAIRVTNVFSPLRAASACTRM